MNGWTITTIVFVILTFVFALIAGWLAVDVRFEKRRTAAQHALHLTAKAENAALQGEIDDLREKMDTSNERYANILVRLDAMKGKNITLQARVADLEEALAEAQKTVPVVEAPKPPRRGGKRTEVPHE